MWEEQLHQAVDLIKKKQFSNAVVILRDVLKHDPNNTSALWLMANAVREPQHQSKILKHLLTINPNHANAKKLLATISIKHKPQAAQNVDYDWSKMSAQAKVDKDRQQSNGSRLAVFAGTLLTLVAIMIFAAVVLIRYAPILTQTPVERDLSQQTRRYLDDVLHSQWVEANDRLCLENRLTVIDVADLSIEYGSIPAGLSFNVSNIRVTEVEQDDDSANGRLIGTIVANIEEDDGTVTRQSIAIADLLRENVDILGGIGSTQVRFGYEFDEWRICP